MAEDLGFETERITDRAGADDERLIVDVDGFEGPLDLLLELARRQKVDLHKISVLALAEQYLAFVDAARQTRLELAADYLVMAAWLAYLKSRLLLPQHKSADEPEAGELAVALAERLRRLEIIRAAAQALGERPQIGRGLMLRGAPDTGVLEGGPPIWSAEIYDLLSAYARMRQKQASSHIVIKKREIWSLAEAREAVQRIVGQAVDWSALDDFLSVYFGKPEMRRTIRASSFSVVLEMVKEGKLALRQDRPFAPLWIKQRAEPESASAS